MDFGFILVIILQVIALFTAIVFHEYAHGWVAYRLGDPTARYSGRLTLNPLAHVDIFGTIIFPLFLFLIRSPFIFGWAKPVPINPLYFRKPYRGMMLVGLAGPVMNCALAAVGAALWYLLTSITPPVYPSGGGVIATNLLEALTLFLAFCIIINIILALFNLIPLPPLDGSRVLTYFLSQRGRMIMHRMEPFGIVGIFIVLFLLRQSGLLERVLWPLLHWLGLGG